MHLDAKICSVNRDYPVDCESIFFDNPSLDQMLLDDPFKDRRRAGVIPDCLRVYDGNRTLNADPQAIGFSPVNQRVGADEVKFFQTLLQILPRLKAFLFRSAIRLRLVGAQKNVTAVFFQSERFDRSS